MSPVVAPDVESIHVLGRWHGDPGLATNRRALTFRRMSHSSHAERTSGRCLQSRMARALFPRVGTWTFHVGDVGTNEDDDTLAPWGDGNLVKGVAGFINLLENIRSHDNFLVQRETGDG